MGKPLHKLVEIWWTDHVTHVGWLNQDSNMPLAKVHSVGWCVKESRDALVLSTSLSEDGEFTDPLVIAKKLITKMRVLRR